MVVVVDVGGVDVVVDAECDEHSYHASSTSLITSPPPHPPIFPAMTSCAEEDFGMSVIVGRGYVS